MKRLMVAIIVLICIATDQSQAATVNDVIASLRQRGVYFDTVRFSPTVVLGITNDVQSMVNSLARPNQAETTYVLTDALKYRLPGRYMLPSAAILNPNPTDPVSYKNTATALKWIPPDEWGKDAGVEASRAQNWTIWKDSLKLNVGVSETAADTVTFEYFRLPVTLDSVIDTVDLPERFLPLLKEYVVYYCMLRVAFTLPGREDTEARLKLFESQLLGRPADEK